MAKTSWKKPSGTSAKLRSMSGMPLSKMPTTVTTAAAKDPSRPLPMKVNSSPTSTWRLRASTRADDDLLRHRVAQEATVLDQTGQARDPRFELRLDTRDLQTVAAVGTRDEGEGRCPRCDLVGAQAPAGALPRAPSTSGTTWRILWSSL